MVEIKTIRYGRKFSTENDHPDTDITKYETELFELEGVLEEGESVREAARELMEQTVKLRLFANKVRQKNKDINEEED